MIYAYGSLGFTTTDVDDQLAAKGGVALNCCYSMNADTPKKQAISLSQLENTLAIL
jgi:hypothetical protein